MPKIAYYLVFYLAILIFVMVGLLTHALPTDVAVTMISLIVGHGSGFFPPLIVAGNGPFITAAQAPKGEQLNG